MTEREDTDIDFDFFEEEPPTESSGNDRTTCRPGGQATQRPSALTNLALLRLVGLIAFAILIVLLVF
jgi:hypothetical protein